MEFTLRFSWMLGKERIFLSINLPIGFGKSLLYRALALVFDLTSQEPRHNVVIVSQLICLMRTKCLI